jgi:hypothetical protein
MGIEMEFVRQDRPLTIEVESCEISSFDDEVSESNDKVEFLQMIK